jgi:hypothetical protein
VYLCVKDEIFPNWITSWGARPALTLPYDFIFEENRGSMGASCKLRKTFDSADFSTKQQTGGKVVTFAVTYSLSYELDL